ncbi:MAG TPA: UDP-N-acetylmuramoyl-L-alanyl-D-glutamate--2,6-diaminopimelate ligase, partial [Gammaproteobacteria bacterium]|nr:UDP-N-acetylmuramoyl-L-alanyl-D-glutamate--2,6-diaminopimelate ligase [Gammaproteobacteria bacterium]
MNAVEISMSTMMLSQVLDKSVKQDVPISGLAVDSRKVKAGDLFLACDGQACHGLDFAAQAIANGAAAIVWESSATRSDEGIYSVPVVPMMQLSLRLGEIAARFFGNPSQYLPLTGITGTNGKTSVAHYLAQILDRPEQRCGVIGTLGNGFPEALVSSGLTTPDA